MDFSTQLDDLQQRATDTKTSAQAAEPESRAQLRQRIDQAKVHVDHKATLAPPVPGRRNLLRMGFGVVLFVAWGILTILWVASTVRSVANGNVAAAVTAVTAVALLVLLALMEGLEVSVIDRWQKLWPGRPPSYLSGWLAARQLFVALIVTAATLLANRSVIVYLWLLQRPLFPIVQFVHLLGVSQPGEWTAAVVEDRLDWSLSPDELKRQRPEHELSHASIWRELGAPRRRKPPTPRRR